MELAPYEPRARETKPAGEAWVLRRYSGRAAITRAPWWHLRSIGLTWPIIACALLYFVATPTQRIWGTNVPLPSWVPAVLGAFALLLAVYRLYRQASSGSLPPVLEIDEHRGLLEIRGVQVQLSDVLAVHLNIVRYRDPEAFLATERERRGFQVDDVQLIVRRQNGLARVTVLSDGSSFAAIASQLAKVIGCPLEVHRHEQKPVDEKPDADD